MVADLYLKRRPLHDTTTRNAFARFDKSLSKKYAEQLEGFSEEDFRQLESLKEISDWLDDMIPDEGEEIDITPKKKGARSRSVPRCS
jgi:condensin complex subunit 3